MGWPEIFALLSDGTWEDFGSMFFFWWGRRGWRAFAIALAGFVIFWVVRGLTERSTCVQQGGSFTFWAIPPVCTYPARSSATTSSTGTTTANYVTPPASTVLSSTSPITSSAERAVLVSDFATAKDIPMADDGPIVSCLVADLRAHGIETHGQFEQPRELPLTRALSAACTRKVLGIP